MSKDVDWLNYSSSWNRSCSFQLIPCSNNDKKELAEHCKIKSDFALDIYNLFLNLNGKEFVGFSHSKNKEFTIEQEKINKNKMAIFAKTKLSLEQFNECSEILVNFIKKDKLGRRQITTLLLGDRNQDYVTFPELEDEKDPKNKTHNEKTIKNYEDLLKLVQCKDSGLFPLLTKNPKYTQSHYYASVALIGEKIASFLQCSDSTSENYSRKKACQESFAQEYEIDKLDVQKAEYEKWLAEMKSLNSFSANRKFINLWRNKIQPALKAGKSFRWSLGDVAKDICMKYSSLFENDMDYIRLFLTNDLYLEDIQNAKSSAIVCFPDLIHSPVFPRFGNNLDKFQVEQKEGDIVLSLKLAHNYTARFVIQPHKNTSVWKLESRKYEKKSKKGKKSTGVKQVILMKRKSDREVKVISLQELTVAYNRQIAEKVGVKGFLAGKVPFKVNLSRQGDSKKLQALASSLKFFESALDTNTAKTYAKLPDKLRFAFLDGGTRPVFSLTFYDFEKSKKQESCKCGLLDSTCRRIIPVFETKNQKLIRSGTATKIDFSQLGKELYPELQKDISKLDANLRSVKACLVFYKKITSLNGFKRVLDEKGIKDLYKIPYKALIDCKVLDAETKKFYTLLDIIGILPNEDEKDIEENIDILLNLSQEKLTEFYNGILGNISWDPKKPRDPDDVKKVLDKYSKLRMDRRMRNAFSSESYKWISTTRNYISLKKSLSYSNKPSLQLGELRDLLDFKRDNIYFKNLKDDMLKQAVSKLRDELVAKKVNVLVLDNLQTFRASVANDKSMNKFLADWSHRTVYKKIKEVLEEVNICVVTCDPRHTSQLDPLTMDWGWRESWRNKNNNHFGNKERLYVKRSDEIECYNDDLAACDVLALRYFSRHRHIVYCKTQRKDNVNLILSENSRRLTAYLKSETNQQHAIINNENELVGISNAEFKRLSSIKGGHVEEYYKHGQIWLNREEHKKSQHAISVDVEDQNCYKMEMKFDALTCERRGDIEKPMTARKS